MYPPPPCSARKVVAAAISSRAPSAQLKPPMPVSTRSLEIGDWYQGSSRLKTITAQPITAMRSLPPRPRRSRSSLRGHDLHPLLERLAAIESRIQVVPVGDLVLAELPAEEHLTPI